MLDRALADGAFDSTRVRDAYGLWLGSWETALKAVATATQARTLSMAAAAGHKALIAVERKRVTEQFAGGLSSERPATEEQP